VVGLVVVRVRLPSSVVSLSVCVYTEARLSPISRPFLLLDLRTLRAQSFRSSFNSSSVHSSDRSQLVLYRLVHIIIWLRHFAQTDRQHLTEQPITLLALSSQKVARVTSKNPIFALVCCRSSSWLRIERANPFYSGADLSAQSDRTFALALHSFTSLLCRSLSTPIAHSH
jgi:hypothetical protein